MSLFTQLEQEKYRLSLDSEEKEEIAQFLCVNFPDEFRFSDTGFEYLNEGVWFDGNSLTDSDLTFLDRQARWEKRDKTDKPSPKKDIETHLMDMMCGWFEFVYEEQDSENDGLNWSPISKQLHAFYQESGNIAEHTFVAEGEPLPEPPPREEIEAEVREFFEGKVFPFIFDKPKKESDETAT